jgi:uncharacterized surface protein with fasciclin (FAS1) repeats
MKGINTVAIACLLFFMGTLNGTSQSENNQILSEVENPGQHEVFELVSKDKNLSTFAVLAVLSGLYNSQADLDGYTLLIPTNDAFKDMTIERFNELTDPKNKSELVKFIKYHTLPEKQMAMDFKDNMVITTDSSDEISVSKDEYDNVFIGGAKVIKANIEASNGVVHVVNGVIDPNVSLAMVD